MTLRKLAQGAAAAVVLLGILGATLAVTAKDHGPLGYTWQVGKLHLSYSKMLPIS